MRASFHRWGGRGVVGATDTLPFADSAFEARPLNRPGLLTRIEGKPSIFDVARDES
jgi:hypothetical protein